MAYPTTEKDITDFEEWTAIKRPALPGRIDDRDMVDVLAVTDDGLEVLEPSGDRTLIGELFTESDNNKTGDLDRRPPTIIGFLFSSYLVQHRVL